MNSWQNTSKTFTSSWRRPIYAWKAEQCRFAFEWNSNVYLWAATANQIACVKQTEKKKNDNVDDNMFYSDKWRMTATTHSLICEEDEEHSVDCNKLIELIKKCIVKKQFVCFSELHFHNCFFFSGGWCRNYCFSLLEIIIQRFRVSWAVKTSQQHILFSTVSVHVMIIKSACLKCVSVLDYYDGCAQPWW